MNRQHRRIGDQLSIKPTFQCRQTRPDIEQPDTLGNNFRSTSSAITPQQQKNGEVLGLGACPHNLGGANAASVSPCMDKIEPQQQPDAKTECRCERPFSAILRIFDDAAILLRPEKAVGQALVEADNLVSFPPRCPLCGAEAAREMNKNVYRLAARHLSQAPVAKWLAAICFCATQNSLVAALD
jgi:hypothetical protein